MVLTNNNQNTSDFFLPHQQLPPVEQFLKSLGSNNNQFGINTSLPDIAFLRQLSVQGRLVFNQGIIISDDGINAQIIPANGTTFFYLSASLSHNAGSALRFQIINDGQTREDFLIGALTSSLGYLQPSLKMDSLVGDGTKSFQIFRSSTTTGTSFVSLMGWLENTSHIRDVTT